MIQRVAWPARARGLNGGRQLEDSTCPYIQTDFSNTPCTESVVGGHWNSTVPHAAGQSMISLGMSLMIAVAGLAQ